MGVHYGKTHAFTAGTKHMTNANANGDLSISINGQTNTQKHLGITIDKNLTWEKHTDLVCQKVSRKITLLNLLSKYVNQNSLKQYYNIYSTSV